MRPLVSSRPVRQELRASDVGWATSARNAREPAVAADSLTMTTAADQTLAPAASAVDDAAVTDPATLLPARAAVLARLAEQLPATDGTPATLLVLGLLRRDDGWPTPSNALAQVTMLLAGSLRGDDWLGSSGPAEFVVVLSRLGHRRAAPPLNAWSPPSRSWASRVCRPLPASHGSRRTSRPPRRSAGRGQPDRRPAGRCGRGRPAPDALLTTSSTGMINCRSTGLPRRRSPDRVAVDHPLQDQAGAGASRSTAAAIRSSVAVRARRTCREPAGP